MFEKVKNAWVRFRNWVKSVLDRVDEYVEEREQNDRP